MSEAGAADSLLDYKIGFAMKKTIDAQTTLSSLQGKFDITTKAGLLETLKFLDSDPRFESMGDPISRFGIKKAAHALESLLSTTESTLQQQRQTAVDIIKAGKDAGVDSLEVTLDQHVGLHFGSNVDGIPIKATMGKSGSMIIKATYMKNDA